MGLTGAPLMRVSKCTCGAEAVARAARVADDLALRDALADGDADARLVAVTGRQPAAVADAGVVAVAADPAGDQDAAGLGGVDRRARRHRDVDARVQAAPAHAERRDDRAVDGPDEAAGARLDRPGGDRPAAVLGRRRAGPGSSRSPSRAARGRPRGAGGCRACWRARSTWRSARAAKASRRSTSWTRTRETASRRAWIASAILVWRFSSTARRLAVVFASARAVRTRSMIRESWSETRFMNSVRSSRSAKPSDSSTTVMTSGLSAL